MNWKRRLLVTFIVALLFGLTLLYDLWAGNYEASHGIIFGVIFIIGMLFVWLKALRERWKRIIEFLGLEKCGAFELIVGPFGGIMLSIYLFLSDITAVIPQVLQFSIIPITAVLGGLVISGANYSKITPECRADLLRVSQNLMVSTISFIFFAVLLVAANVGGAINPNQVPETQLGWIKLIFYWIALLLFVLGISLFVIGIINLLKSLNNLKKKEFY